jgi:hypothetical protein
MEPDERLMIAETFAKLKKIVGFLRERQRLPTRAEAEQLGSVTLSMLPPSREAFKKTLATLEAHVRFFETHGRLPDDADEEAL